MAKALSKQAIKKRLVRLNNLERLYIKARKRITELEDANKELTEIVKEQYSIIEQLMIRVEQLEKMIFGHKRKKDKDDQIDKDSSNRQSDNNQQKKKRSPNAEQKPKTAFTNYPPIEAKAMPKTCLAKIIKACE